MTDLVERIRAALDAEEARLHALPPFPWKLNPDDDTEVYAADDVVVAEAWALSTSQQQRVALHILAGSPEHGLRMVAAHRQILDLYTDTVEVRDIAWDEYRAGRMPTHVKARDADDAQRELAVLNVVLEVLAEARDVEVTA